MVNIKQDVVRRIDGLGRVVIPIHLRKKLNLSEDDLVEIELVDSDIVVRKHDFLSSNYDILSKICESIYQATSGTILIINEETIIASYGERKKIYTNGSALSRESIIRINGMDSIKSNTQIIEGYVDERNSLFVPIIGESSLVKGMVVYLYEGILQEKNRNIIQSYAIFISVLMR